MFLHFFLATIEKQKKGEKGERAIASIARLQLNSSQKDKKFGLGGKKRGLKRNSADSASDMSGFSKRAYKKVPAGISKNKKTKAKVSKSKFPAISVVSLKSC